MKIIKVGLGNTDEAYIESEFSDGINKNDSDSINAVCYWKQTDFSELIQL